MVDAIVEHVSLHRDEGDLCFDNPLTSRLEESDHDQALVIFIAREHRKKAENEIIVQLNNRLQMDRYRLLSYFREPLDQIEDGLQEDGIETMSPEDDDRYAFGRAQPTVQATYTDSNVQISSVGRHDSQLTGGNRRRRRQQSGSSQTAMQTNTSSTQSCSLASQSRVPLADLEGALNKLEEQIYDLALSADAVYTADSVPNQRVEALATQYVRSPQTRGDSEGIAEAEVEPESRFSATAISTASSSGYAQPRSVTTAASAMASIVASLTSSTSVFGGNDEHQKVNGILGERYVSTPSCLMYSQPLTKDRPMRC